MNKRFIYSLVIGAVLTPATLLAGGAATPAPTNSQVQAQLRVDVDKDTDEVHFIQKNNDPYVFTKVYVLKHADPMEIKPYVRTAIQAQRVNTSGAHLETIRYNDGTGALIVSAEEYRFGKQKEGMGIDEIIATLDQPSLTSSSGTKSYLYFPKYWKADDLETIMETNGINVKGDNLELQDGKDKVTSDDTLNALLFYIPPYNVKNAEEIIKIYDTPYPEVTVNYKVYEIFAENDAQIGTDFQSWKNGPGTDLFAAASRFSEGWNVASDVVRTRSFNFKDSHAKYLHFSPKYNTKYIDFLASSGKAKVMTSGSLAILNGTTGTVNVTSKLAYLEDGAANTATTVDAKYVAFNGQSFAGNDFSAVDRDGRAISLLTDTGAAVTASMDFVAHQVTPRNGETYYYLHIEDAADAYFYDVENNKIGKTVKAYDFSMTTPAITWVDHADGEFTIDKDADRDGNAKTYGFNLSITPTIGELATTLAVDADNTSLIGFTDDGNPRTSKSEIDTKVQIANDGQRFVIGGITKETVVSSTNKVPYLGDIPGLGWILGGESEARKKSQIVIVLDAIPTSPNAGIPDECAGKIMEVKDKAIETDKSQLGYDQLLLDSEKGFDPLP